MRLRTDKSRRSRPKRGALVVISAFFLCSVIVRLGATAAQAVANEQPSKTVAQEAPTTEPKKDMAKLEAMLAAFEAREEKISSAEALMKSRMQALSLAEEKINQKLKALIQAEADLKRTLTIADSAAEDDLTRLTTVYENMKPKDAAALFEQMDPEFSAGFLGRMKPAAAAAVLAGVSAERAYTISVILAGRNANAPKK